ncbi:hypothetical protein G6F46_009503 [Rhizopus delemar]|uniref:Uncharacterized protein n=2 Tax=Rhizopus TaxID=4842 RepID=A0A9P6YY84_9FUNG|nr:hypothetical protein G6F43_012476 [Rhizopus delemar]KAG1147161.1 hypothetical protein G6F36_014956 [Rhizopus arrhizus]KAG1464477.1 hypothetical protein G6F55_001761 [Rhizopus delemar]KAG1488373.1 hypothetical protein G6F54_012109 [Rhizopus delemar]KAG1507038.1 hypothetical protein G6F53_009246 [Rhizopus delemar]
MNQEHVYLWIDANPMHSSQTKSDAITRQDGRMRGMLDGKSKRVRDHGLVSDAHPVHLPPSRGRWAAVLSFAPSDDV